jgi:hypothetical protein
MQERHDQPHSFGDSWHIGDHANRRTPFRIPNCRSASSGRTRFESPAVAVQPLWPQSPASPARLLQTPYNGWVYAGTPVTPALLRLDPTLGPFAWRSRFPKALRGKAAVNRARFRSTVDCNGRTIWIADAHRGDRKRFVVRADEMLTAFVEFRRSSFLEPHGEWFRKDSRG